MERNSQRMDLCIFAVGLGQLGQARRWLRISHARTAQYVKAKHFTRTIPSTPLSWNVLYVSLSVCYHGAVNRNVRHTLSP